VEPDKTAMKVTAWDGSEAPASVLRRAAALLRERKDDAGEWTLMLAACLDDVARDADDARVVNGSLDLSYCDYPEPVESALDIARAYLAEDAVAPPPGKGSDGG
jgi:hypothetical protein